MRSSSLIARDYLMRDRADLEVSEGHPGHHAALLIGQIAPRLGEAADFAPLGIVPHDPANLRPRLPSMNLADDGGVGEEVPATLRVRKIGTAWCHLVDR